MIIMIRGHIRESFKTQNLYNLIKDLYELFPNLQIYIHTWNIFANNISWRNIVANINEVNETIIFQYFNDLQHLIKKIIIDDDTKIELVGNLYGNVGKGPMPLIGWKNYWYGKYKIIDYIYNNNDINKNEMIVNLRFDIMNNSNSFYKKIIVDFIKFNSKKSFAKNIFLFNDEKHCGIDNIYIGNVYTQHKLINAFFYKLDGILIKYSDIIHQEMLVYRINEILFRQKTFVNINNKKNNKLKFTFAL